MLVWEKVDGFCPFVPKLSILLFTNKRTKQITVCFGKMAVFPEIKEFRCCRLGFGRFFSQFVETERIARAFRR